MRPPASAPLLLAALLLAACSGPSQPGTDPTPTVAASSTAAAPETTTAASTGEMTSATTHREAVGGPCYEAAAGGETDARTAAPDFSTTVPCMQPHAFELTGLLEAPPEFVDPTADLETIRAKVAEFNAGGSSIDAAAAARCGALRASAAGLPDQVGGVESKIAGLDLYGYFGQQATLVPAETIKAEGIATIACTSGFYTPEVTLTSVVSPDAKPALTSFFTPGAFPVEQRVCLADGITPCAQEHAFEYTVRYDAEAVFGRPFVDAVIAGGEEQKASMGLTCAETIKGLIVSRGDISMVGADMDGWAQQESGPYYVTCMVVSLQEGVPLVGAAVDRP